MEMMAYSGRFIKRQWRRRGYNRVSSSSSNKPRVRIVRFGSGRCSWRLRIAPRLRVVRLASPLKLWCKFKNAYMKMMIKLAHTCGSSNSSNVFGEKRIPQARDVPAGYNRTEFENWLVLEIYKSMVASLELGYVNK